MYFVCDKSIIETGKKGIKQCDNYNKITEINPIFWKGWLSLRK